MAYIFHGNLHHTLTKKFTQYGVWYQAVYVAHSLAVSQGSKMLVWWILTLHGRITKIVHICIESHLPYTFYASVSLGQVDPST